MILAIDQGTTGTTSLVVSDELHPVGRAYRELTQSRRWTPPRRSGSPTSGARPFARHSTKGARSARVAERDILLQRRQAAIIGRVRRRAEPPLDSETLDGLITILMRIDAKLDRVLWLLEEEDDDGEEEEAEP